MHKIQVTLDVSILFKWKSRFSFILCLTNHNYCYGSFYSSNSMFLVQHTLAVSRKLLKHHLIVISFWISILYRRGVCGWWWLVDLFWFVVCGGVFLLLLFFVCVCVWLFWLMPLCEGLSCCSMLTVFCSPRKVVGHLFHWPAWMQLGIAVLYTKIHLTCNPSRRKEHRMPLCKVLVWSSLCPDWSNWHWWSCLQME